MQSDGVPIRHNVVLIKPFNMLCVIDRIWHHKIGSETVPPETAHQLADDHVVLSVLTRADADSFFALHTAPSPHNSWASGFILQNDTPDLAAQRTVEAFDLIWTIRLASCPERIIGDCSLRRAESDIPAFAYTLFPEQWLETVIISAYLLVSAIARNTLHAQAISYTARKNDVQALRFAEILGFQYLTQSSSTLTMLKQL